MNEVSAPILGNIRVSSNGTPQVYTNDGYVDWSSASNGVIDNTIRIEHNTTLDIDGFEITGKQLKMLLQILVKQNPEILY